MLTTTLVALLFGALGQATATAADANSNAPVLNISAHLVRSPHSTDTSTAGDSGTGMVDSFAWSNGGCGIGAGREPVNAPTAGWHFTGRVLQRAGDSLTVRIEWQRVWDRDTRPADPKTGSINRTMTIGDRIELDRVEITSSNCGAGVFTLEAVAQLPGTGHGVFGGVQGGQGAGVGSGVAGGGAGGRGVATGAAGGVGGGVGASAIASGSGGGARAGGRGGAGGGVGTGVSGGGAGSGSGSGQQVFGVELWLVLDSKVSPNWTWGAASGSQAGGTQRGPDGLYQFLRFPASGSGFVFPAVGIGNVSVIVTGTISARLVNGAPSTLVVTVSRQVTGVEPSSNGSSSTKEIAWPASGDVISFELPPTTGPGHEALAGHQLALRLRLITGR